MKQLSSIQLQQQIIHYKSEMEKYRQKCSFLAEESLAQKYTALQKENQDLRKKVDEYGEYLENKELQLDKQSQDSLSHHIAQEKEITKLRFTVNQLRDQLRKINHLYITDSKLHTERLQLSKGSFHKDIIASQMTICHLTNEMEKFLSTKEEMEKQLYKKEIELWELEKRLGEMEKEWNRKQESFLLKSVCQENRIDLLANENDTLKTQLYLKEEVVNDAFQQLKDMTFYYEDILFHQTKKLTEASRLERNHEESIRTLKNKLKKQQADIEMYTNTLQTVKMNIRQMKEEAFISDGGDSSETKKLLKKQENTIQHLQFTNALLIEEINKLKNKMPGHN